MLLPMPDLSLRPTHNFWGTSRTSAACPVHGKWEGLESGGVCFRHVGRGAGQDGMWRMGLSVHLHPAEGAQGTGFFSMEEKMEHEHTGEQV